MFTGLIETIGSVRSVRRSSSSMRLTVNLGDLASQCKTCESVSISGVCLTITKIEGTSVDFDISCETLSKTTLGKLQASSKVNIELAMKPTERFGGHFVLGHVDGTAGIEKIDKSGEFADFKFSASSELIDSMVEKGSVAVDGISLTISRLDKSSFNVAVIPQTMKLTTLGVARTGDIVNIETDIIMKAVKKQLEHIFQKKDILTAEKLREAGF
jgi:riboflavin synthase